MSDLERQERIRKIERLRDLGFEPYPHRFARTHEAGEIHAGFERLSANPEPVVVAGRVVARRDHGKTAFLTLRDSSGSVQIYLRRDEIGDQQFALYELLDLGDFLGVTGQVVKTRMGEISVQARRLDLLGKALRPLPSQWHGLKEVETRYRQRYVDLVMNPQVFEVFRTRTRIITLLRQILDGKGALEVETPTLQPLYGGASARPFVTHHNALGIELYLRIADELYLKRLIVGGYEMVYEICKDFRNEGMDRTHNPEFTMMEVYWAYRDYHDMMDLTQEIFTTLAMNLHRRLTIEFQGQEVDLTPPWPRRPILSLIAEYAGVDCATASDEELRSALRRLAPPPACGGEADQPDQLDGISRARLIGMLFDSAVEPNLVQPTFVIDYPKETSPLAKEHRFDPTLTERFELYICRREMANAFSELNDPLDQRARFESQLREKEAGDEEAQVLDEDFLRALEYGMPPTGGLGIGIDRLVMLLTDQSSIADVIFFPQMRPER